MSQVLLLWAKWPTNIVPHSVVFVSFLVIILNFKGICLYFSHMSDKKWSYLQCEWADMSIRCVLISPLHGDSWGDQSYVQIQTYAIYVSLPFYKVIAQ